ncbi:hypothetical protein [Methylophaga pinxianii]|uniref:hypothetical protein n=1 Tax=Methylophaga pinxianii TaxID=2881052 RepID=UPI001CF4AA93|nr:hypothetical protein [Methylophaga pinxianii]MCB2425777.1 hypothetical protein [Methylophaga pinxianii]UPH46377.1 hypothetical protein LGT42_003605 [Methylophaga pinxianii]
MGIIGIINVPFLIGAIGTLLFFIWLGRYAERIDKKRKKPPQRTMYRKLKVLREKE